LYGSHFRAAWTAPRSPDIEKHGLAPVPPEINSGSICFFYRKIEIKGFFALSETIGIGIQDTGFKDGPVTQCGEPGKGTRIPQDQKDGDNGYPWPDGTPHGFKVFGYYGRAHSLSFDYSDTSKVRIFAISGI
jgi:hypothetical protein